MKDEIYTITQLGAMNKWIIAICNDINKISEYICQTARKQKRLQNHIAELQFENVENNRRVKELQEEILTINNNSSICNKKLEIGN